MKETTAKPCLRCGACCKTYLFAYVQNSDIEVWKKEERGDILDLLEKAAPVWAGDRMVSANTGKHMKSCPFFKWDGEYGGCAIYEVRPRVCRDYHPGDNEMCPQFSSDVWRQILTGHNWWAFIDYP